MWISTVITVTTMSGARTEVVVAGDRSRGERYADWARDRWGVVTVPDAGGAVATVNGETRVVVVAGALPDAPLDWLAGQLQATDHDPQVVAVVEDTDQRGATRVDDLLDPSLDRRTFRERLERAMIRAAYRDRLREYYALASQKAMMEARHSRTVLADSREYARLADRADRRRQQVDELLAEISETDDVPAFDALLPDTVA